MVGGANRLSTMRTVLSKMPSPASVVVIQEASRPFVTKELVSDTVKSAKRYGCAIAAHKIPDAVKSVPKGMKVSKTLERNTVWAAQTPQLFRTSALADAIDAAHRADCELTDEASAMEFVGARPKLVMGSVANIKITHPTDLAIAEALLGRKEQAS